MTQLLLDFSETLKEAEEWVKKEFPLLDVEHTNLEESITEYRAYKDGAEFGYNKANEWHFVKDGDIPKDEDYKLCITSNGKYYIARYEELFVHWSNQEYKEVCCPYAWKEITLPALPNEVKEK